jgi:hypothetical protein
MDKYVFFENWYHKENERHIAIHDALNTPIGVIAALSAVFVFQINSFNFDLEKRFWVESIFLFFFALSVICWMVSIIYLIRCYNNFFRGYQYKALPYASELNKHYSALEVFAEENETPEATSKIFQSQLADMFVEYLDANIVNNDTKTRFLFRCKQTLFGCVLLSFFSLSFFCVNYLEFKSVKNSSEVIIKSLPVINYKADMSDKPKPTPPPPPPPRLIKEGFNQAPPPRETPPLRPTPPAKTKH